MKSKIIISVGTVACALALVGSVNAASINDDYIGAYYGLNPNSGNYETYAYPDVIGNPLFNISKMDVTLGSTLQVDIHTTYVNIVGSNDGIGYGDLFLSNDGYNPTVPSSLDHQLNGEFWEYALVLDNHEGKDASGNAVTSGTVSLFAVNSVSELILAENAGSSVYRAGQEVLYNTQGQQALGTGTWTTFATGISFSIDASLLSLGTDDLGIRWAMTCANDIIEGSVPTDPVPEPATMLLFGAGLAGLAGLRSRKNKA